MPRTLGYHVVLSAYGQWLPGDGRGSWSAAYDKQLGYVEPHQLHPGDPVRERMARERMAQPAVRFSASIRNAVADAIARCAVESDWQTGAFTLEPTHAHLLLTYTGRPIEKTVKWLKQSCTKAVHTQTAHDGKVWCEGSWRVFVFEPAQWNTTTRYIQQHHERRGHGPHDFVTPILM